MHVQRFSKMDPTTEAYGCMSTHIMSWDFLPFWSPRSLPVHMQTESIPWTQGWAFYLLALAELSFCHQLCPCSVWVRTKLDFYSTWQTRCSAQRSTFTSVAIFLTSVAAEKFDSGLKKKKRNNESLPYNYWVHMPQLLKPAPYRPCAPQLESSPCLLQLETAHVHATKIQHSQKINK